MYVADMTLEDALYFEKELERECAKPIHTEQDVWDLEDVRGRIQDLTNN